MKQFVIPQQFNKQLSFRSKAKESAFCSDWQHMTVSVVERGRNPRICSPAEELHHQ
jgi:hypothetical protein